MKSLFLFLLIFQLFPVQAQSDIDKVIRGGEILLGGLSILKVARSDPKSDSATIETLCIRNKTQQTIRLVLTKINVDEDTFIKELVIPVNDKDCLLDIPKGTYSYTIYLPNEVIHKKGEMKIDENISMTIKPN